MIHFITGNRNKFEEAKKIIPELDILELDLDEIQELDPKKIIEHKIKEALKSHSGPFVIDDVGIEIMALNGFPGPLAKWFLKSLGLNGVYNLVKKSEENNGAVFYAQIGYAENPDNIIYFQGAVHGKIVAPKGEKGFGFDPIFMPDGFDKTFAEMTTDEKNSLSHRGKAFHLLKQYLDSKRV